MAEPRQQHRHQPDLPPDHEHGTSPSNRRAYYRVQYPVHDCPIFTSDDLSGDVTDCSETGVRVRVMSGPEAGTSLRSEDRLVGSVRFVRGEEVDVSGSVLRYDGRILVLKLDAATIPYGAIIREQRWMRNKYPCRD